MSVVLVGVGVGKSVMDSRYLLANLLTNSVPLTLDLGGDREYLLYHRHPCMHITTYDPLLD